MAPKGRITRSSKKHTSGSNESESSAPAEGESHGLYEALPDPEAIMKQRRRKAGGDRKRTSGDGIDSGDEGVANSPTKRPKTTDSDKESPADIKKPDTESAAPGLDSGQTHPEQLSSDAIVNSVETTSKNTAPSCTQLPSAQSSVCQPPNVEPIEAESTSDVTPARPSEGISSGVLPVPIAEASSAAAQSENNPIEDSIEIPSTQPLAPDLGTLPRDPVQRAYNLIKC